MSDPSWQTVVITLIVQAAAVASLWTARRSSSGSQETVPVSPHVEI